MVVELDEIQPITRVLPKLIEKVNRQTKELNYLRETSYKLSTEAMEFKRDINDLVWRLNILDTKVGKRLSCSEEQVASPVEEEKEVAKTEERDNKAVKKSNAKRRKRRTKAEMEGDNLVKTS